MKSSLLFVARMLMIEQRYQAIKKSPGYASEDPDGVRRKLGKFLQVSYAANSISFAVFSFLLITPYVFSGGGIRHVANIGFIVYVYALVISIYSSALFFNSISSMYLLEPVAALPFPGKRKAVLLSWFLYSGSSSIFIIVPSAVWISLATGSIVPVVLGPAWAIIFSMAGYSIGALLNAFITGRERSERVGFVNTVKSTMKVFIMLMVFVVFEIGIYLPGIIPDFIPGLSFPLNRLIPIVNVSYVVFLGNRTAGGILVDAGVTGLYFAIFSVLMAKANSYVVARTLERGANDSVLGPDRSARYSQGSLVLSLFLKEVRIVARKSQNVILLFIPIIFVFPTILSVLIYGSAGGVRNTGTYFSLLSILIVCSSFYSLIMVVSEGNGIETLFSLPLSGRDIVYSKASFGLVVFAVIIIPVTILIIGGGSSLSSYDILVPANLILGYAYSSLFNIKRLLAKLPKDATTVNFYSFGGAFSIIKLFIVTSAITLVPVLASAGVTSLLFQSIYSGEYFFYLLDSVINFIALMAVVGSIGRSDPLLGDEMPFLS